jgi:hypothetical protein
MKHRSGAAFAPKSQYRRCHLAWRQIQAQPGRMRYALDAAPFREPESIAGYPVFLKGQGRLELSCSTAITDLVKIKDRAYQIAVHIEGSQTGRVARIIPMAVEILLAPVRFDLNLPVEIPFLVMDD